MRISKFVFGLVIILVGAALLFDKLDVSGSAIPGDYWPVLLIVMGFFGWFGRSLFPHLGSMLMMSLGGILLAQNLIDDKSFVDFWPVLAIAVGLSIIFGPRHGKNRKKKFRMNFEGGGGGRWNKRRRSHSGHDTNEFFSDSSRKVDGEYTGSVAHIKLAGGSLDLTEAVLPEAGAVLELDIVLGGYKIRVPNNWKIDIDADVTMGEISDNRSDSSEEGRTVSTLTVGGRVLMGGVEISN
jgi:predicted membrane protein